MENNQISMENNFKHQINSSLSQPLNTKYSEIPNNHRKLKPIFNHKWANWRCMIPSDISYINKYKPKISSQIAITTLNSENIGTNGLRNLRKAITDTKRASTLTFENAEINAKQLTYLLDSTNHWRRLSFLSLQQSERMDRELIKVLPRLGRCKNLLNIPFPCHLIDKYVSRKIVSRFCRQLRQLNKLQDLSLDVPLFNSPIILDYKPPQSLKFLILYFGDKTLLEKPQLSAFVSNIQKCSRLVSLSLMFSPSYRIQVLDAEIWTSFFQNPPPFLQGLQLTLNPDPAQQQSEGIHQFIDSVKHLKTLKSFRFELRVSPAILNQHVKCLDPLLSSLFASLGCLTQLETLEFKCPHSFNFEKRILRDFNSGLQCLKNLKNLIMELDLLYFEAPNESLVEIGHSLKQLRSLQIISLRLEPRTPFSYESVEIFSKSLAGLPLISLSLSFGSFQEMTRQPMFDFSAVKSGFGKMLGLFKSNEKPNLTPFFSDISRFNELHALKLILSGYRTTSQEWISLSHALSKLKNLSSLNLSLPQFDSSNDFEGLQNLFSCLEDMKKLTHMTLLFQEKVSNEEVRILSSFLVDCQSLTSLNVIFYKASQLQDESLYFLLGALRGLANLKILFLLFEKQDLQTLARNQNQEDIFGKQAVSHFLQGLTVLKNLSALSLLFNLFWTTQYNCETLPPHLKEYEKNRQLIRFIVGNSRYI